MLRQGLRASVCLKVNQTASSSLAAGAAAAASAPNPELRTQVFWRPVRGMKDMVGRSHLPEIRKTMRPTLDMLSASSLCCPREASRAAGCVGLESRGRPWLESQRVWVSPACE